MLHVHRKPDVFQRLTQMGDVTLYEPAGDNPSAEQAGAQRLGRGSNSFQLSDCVAHVQTPKGAKPVLKTMMTTACERNCFYCPFRAGQSKMKRVTVTPDEMASAFVQMESAKLVDGLFLSSGIIKGGVTSQDKIIDTVEILRRKHDYRGYIHLKIMPGAEYDQLVRAMQLADRVSINLEGPTPKRLNALAPKKDLHNELLVQLRRAHAIRQNDPRIRASIVTQFVVGAVGDTDLELLSLSHGLYNRLGLARAYYSSFSPVPGTPFENLPRSAQIRERRLYQASFLLRDYGWDVEELPLVGAGNLRTDVDPKVAYADATLRHAPVEIMTADRGQLMRIPGIGPKTADAILNARAQRTLRDIGQLSRLGVRTADRTAPYILLDGARPPTQPRLF